ncbi:MAG: HEAT repeat domain-containing protein [Thermodesulfovibrionales bacterium]
MQVSQASDDVRTIRDIIQTVLKSRKILRMYPENNPIYVNALEECYSKFKNLFYSQDDLTLTVRQNEILYHGEQVYHSPEKEDNLAIFFFKDGLREISFRKGLPAEELESFLRIISLDFNRDVLDDDIITLFWERDFQKIQYVVDDVVLSDDDDYEEQAVAEAKAQSGSEDNVMKAYEDAFKETEQLKDILIVPLTDKDLQLLLTELDEDNVDKTPKLIEILFEMIYLSETAADFEDLFDFFKNAIELVAGRGDIHLLVQTQTRLQEMTEGKIYGEDIRKLSRRIMMFTGGEQIIMILGDVLDSGQESEEKIFEEFVKYLDRNAIVPLMKILGELKSIHARKLVIDALVFLGTKDISLLAKGLTDTRWYVVRNIIYILRKIGDKRAVDYLLKTVKHGDIRVKKEVIRALGELGGGGVLQALRDCLDDPDAQVRSSALKALSNIGSEASKRIILNKVNDKFFKDKEYEEKKEFFETLPRWKDEEIYNFLVSTVKQNVFFGRSKNYENRACAASALGILGRKDSLPVLQKLRNDGNKLLREAVMAAMKRIVHDGQ